jgi:hypothetical protein
MPDRSTDAAREGIGRHVAICPVSAVDIVAPTARGTLTGIWGGDDLAPTTCGMWGTGFGGWAQAQTGVAPSPQVRTGLRAAAKSPAVAVSGFAAFTVPFLAIFWCIGEFPRQEI